MTRHFVSVFALLAAVSVDYCSAQPPKNLTTLPASAFEHVYRHVRHLQKVDADAAASGRPTNLGAYYQNLANLTPSQAEALRTVSLAALAELEALDAEAKELILKARAEVRAKPPANQKPPEPPPQLAALHGKRKAALAKHRASLAQALGPAGFAKLEQSLIVKFKVGPQAAAAAPNQGSGH